MGRRSRNRDVGWGRDWNRDCDRDRTQSRGQTAVLGIVLLIGVVAISSLGILLVASETTSQIKEQSERERVEGAFVELSTVMASSSTNDDISQTMDLAAGQQGAVAKKDTGWIRVEANDSELINETIGTIEYEGDDGTRIAYQAGGVWRETGNQTQMVSAPPIHYDPTTETFSFPIVTVGGEQTLGSGDISVTHNNTQTFRNASVIKDSSITITVKSEYYRGWEGYFARQAGAPVIQDVDHDERTVTVRLGYLEIEDAFDSGITVSEPPGHQGNADVDDTDVTIQHGSMPELDEVIAEMIADMNTTENRQWSDTPDNGPWILDGSGTQGPFENGTYFASGVDLDDNITFDLADGNASLIVDGDINVTGSLEVINWEQPGDENHTLKIYSTGNLDVHGGELYPEPNGNDANAQQVQVYGTSNMSIGFHGGTFEGTLYAPSNDFSGPNEVIQEGQCSDQQACFHSNPDFHGAIIVSTIHFQGGAGNTFQYDDQLEDAPIDIHPEEYTLPPQLTYLNIFHHEVDVENS